MRVIAKPADGKITPDINIFELQLGKRSAVARYETENNTSLFQFS